MSALTDVQDSIDAIGGQHQAAKEAISAAFVAYVAACKAGTAGLLATAAEVNRNTAVTSGTAPASLTAVLGLNMELDEFHTAALYLGAGAGTQVTATAVELNKNAVVTPGTAATSKTAVLGASENLDILGLPVEGLKIGAAGFEVAVTPTAAEINKLSGIASTLTAVELSLMDGVTDTTAELNLVDDLPTLIVMTHAPGGANECAVTINVLDAAGVALDTPTMVDFWLSDAVNGLGITDIPADSIAATKGNVVHVDTAAASVRLQTAADGIAILTITDATKGLFYLCASLPHNGYPQVHTPALTVPDYT